MLILIRYEVDYLNLTYNPNVVFYNHKVDQINVFNNKWGLFRLK